MEKFDLIVIGTGPAGEKAAVKAAYFGYKVAIIEKEKKFGGAETILGTLPSKTLKETALYLSNKYAKGLFSVEQELQRHASVADFMYRKNCVSNQSAEEVEQNLLRHGVTIFLGTASFQDEHTLLIQGEKELTLYGDYIIIASGSYPFHPENIPFDHHRVHDSDTILSIDRFPSSLSIVGAGVIGCEYATIFATMGTKVTLINDKAEILPNVDKEVREELVKEMGQAGIEIYFNKSIDKVVTPKKEEEAILITLKSGEEIRSDMLLFAAGRSGHIQDLNLEKLGIQCGKRQQILVDKTYRTNVPNIYAVGDVIGYPALVSTSMEQGRVAVAHIYKTHDLEHLPTSFPFGIYTIPEVSMVGLNEEEAKEQKIDYGVGKASYADMPRGKILGSSSGFLKIIFRRPTLQIIGVHIIGQLATELIHYGVVLIEEKKDLNYVISQVFNYPTLHDLYKYAAYDGFSGLYGHRVK